MTLLDRFWAKVDRRSDDECWPWTGARMTGGYGHLQHGPVGAGTVLAHRVAYELEHGPIPAGLVIDHLCRNQSCVNPAHLDAVTYRENARRGIKGELTTHCPHGHEYSPSNTDIRPSGWRRCRTCHRERERARRRTRAQEASSA